MLCVVCSLFAVCCLSVAGVCRFMFVHVVWLYLLFVVVVRCCSFVVVVSLVSFWGSAFATAVCYCMCLRCVRCCGLLVVVVSECCLLVVCY